LAVGPYSLPVLQKLTFGSKQLLMQKIKQSTFKWLREIEINSILSQTQ
jgi:hypothetical protein